MPGEPRILRLRTTDSRQSIDIAPEYTPPDGAAALLGVTQTEATYPTNANRFYAMDTTLLDGDETEGAAVTFTVMNEPAGKPIFYAYNIGSKIPPPETAVICHSVGGRWVFQYEGPEQ